MENKTWEPFLKKGEVPTNIRNERRTTIPEAMKIKKMMKEYYEQLYANTFENVE